MKTCRNCNVEKPESEYRKDKKTSDGLMYICRECDNARKRKWHKATHERSDDVHTECICPRYGQKHITKLFWTGRGTPHKFCESCQWSVETFSYAAIEYDRPKEAREVWA